MKEKIKALIKNERFIIQCIKFGVAIFLFSMISENIDIVERKKEAMGIGALIGCTLCTIIERSFDIIEETFNDDCLGHEIYEDKNICIMKKKNIKDNEEKND